MQKKSLLFSYVIIFFLNITIQERAWRVINYLSIIDTNILVPGTYKFAKNS